MMNNNFYNQMVQMQIQQNMFNNPNMLNDYQMQQFRMQNMQPINQFMPNQVPIPNN